MVSMIFLNKNFASTPITPNYHINYETIFNMINVYQSVIDEIFGTKKYIDNLGDTIIEFQDYDTILHGTFNKTINAGNIEYSREQLSAIKLKRRYPDMTGSVWKTIYYQDTFEKIEDYNISMIDYLEPSNTNIEYMFVPVLNNESEITDTNGTNIASVHSDFYNWYIVGQDAIYPCIIDMECVPSINAEIGTIVPLNSRYAYTIRNGSSQYYSGTMTATFIEIVCDNETYPVRTNEGQKYRNELDRFLLDGRAKIIKSFEGDIYLTNLSTAPKRTMNEHYQNISTSFDQVEIGNQEHVGNLYDNGFINTDIDRGLDIDEILLSNQ